MSAHSNFVSQASQCAVMFRLGRDVEAGLLMIELIGALQPSLEQLSLQNRQQCLQILGLMLQCQEAQNWLALADYLEYELAELLAELKL